jgi:hypothetical protein
VSDIDTVVVDSLKALDPEWPIREADLTADIVDVPQVPLPDLCTAANEAHATESARGCGFPNFRGCSNIRE